MQRLCVGKHPEAGHPGKFIVLEATTTSVEGKLEKQQQLLRTGVELLDCVRW